MFQKRKSIQHITFLFDIIIQLVSLIFAMQIKYFFEITLSYYYIHLRLLCILSAVWLLLSYIMYLYSIDIYISFYKLVYKLFICFIVTTFLGFYIFYDFEDSLKTKEIILRFNSLVFILTLFSHFMLKKIFMTNILKNKFIFIGYNKDVSDLIKLTKVKHYGNYLSVGIFDTKSKKATIKTEEELREVIKKENIHIFVMASNYTITEKENDILFEALSFKAKFYSLPIFYEMVTRKIPIGSISNAWLLNKLTLNGKDVYLFFKRVADIVFSLVGLIISLPLWPLLAIVIKAESKGPVIFTQDRVGLHGKKFMLYKFRTMRATGNSYIFTAKDDPRVTKFGKFMRKTRLDEIPQLINVIKGEMSLIGPRPERPEYTKELQKDIPYYNQRLLIRPGITGWDQVSGEYHSPSKEDTYKKLQNDLYYIKNCTLSLDFSIAMKTIATVFMKEGI